MIRHTRLASASLSLLIFPGIAASQTLVGRDDSIYSWRGTVASGALLTVANYNGPVTIRPADGNQAELRAEKKPSRGGGDPRDVAFDIRTASNGDVMLCATYRDHDPCDQDDRWSHDDRGDNRSVRVEMTVRVPRGVRVKVQTGNGAVSVQGTTGDVQAASGNGRVEVLETGGTVRAATGNGDVDVRDAKGAVHVSTGNGRVNVNTTQGPVEASTGNGDIDVRMTALRAADDMSFSTGNGRVRVTLPANYNGELDASTGNGDLQSDFELRIQGRMNPRRVRATIGEGGPRLRLTSGSGRLEVRKGS